MKQEHTATGMVLSGLAELFNFIWSGLFTIPGMIIAVLLVLGA